MIENLSTVASATTPYPQILIVTGYSGAGKSSVLRALEDSGFLCIDNLPIPLLNSFFQLVLQAKINGQRVALGLDVRSGSTMQELIQELELLGNWKSMVKIFFVTSSSPVLLKRFQETRRKHPLADSIDIADAIAQEQHLMKPFIAMADLILDTDQLNIHQLRSFVRNSFATQQAQKVLVTLVSFGFKYGVPPESNFVYDVSSLPNPYFIPALKAFTGSDKVIKDYLFEHPDVQEYWNKFIDFVHYSIKKSYQEGRLFITIAVGCTGGRHRSVAFVEKLALHSLDNVQFLIKHRDIGNESERYKS